jgi:hypothetical protein
MKRTDNPSTARVPRLVSSQRVFRVVSEEGCGWLVLGPWAWLLT